jgi:hypothetical protein
MSGIADDGMTDKKTEEPLSGYVGFCAGFRTPAMTRPADRLGCRRRKSAKARNRGGVGTVGAARSMGI